MGRWGIREIREMEIGYIGIAPAGRHLCSNDLLPYFQPQRGVISVAQ